MRRIERDQYSLQGVAWNRDFIDLVKKTVGGKDLTDDEFKLFAFRARASGLNPLLGHLIPIKFNQGKESETLAFITSIDGYRSIAEKSGELAGVDDYLYDDGKTQFQMLQGFKGEGDRKKVIPKTATCTVYRIVKGIRCPSTATVRWADYLPTWQNRQTMWYRMPFLMLGKCAEALALRKAFPHLFDGIKTDVEMEQATEKVQEVGNREANVELVNRINEGYSILGYSEAQKIAANVKYTGRNEITFAPPEQLNDLLKAVMDEVSILEGKTEAELAAGAVVDVAPEVVGDGT